MPSLDVVLMQVLHDSSVQEEIVMSKKIDTLNNIVFIPNIKYDKLMY